MCNTSRDKGCVHSEGKCHSITVTAGNHGEATLTVESRPSGGQHQQNTMRQLQQRYVGTLQPGICIG